MRRPTSKSSPPPFPTSLHPPAPPPQVCTSDGTCFDLLNAVPYIQKFHRHPVTGEPLELKDLVSIGCGFHSIDSMGFVKFHRHPGEPLDLKDLVSDGYWVWILFDGFHLVSSSLTATR